MTEKLLTGTLSLNTTNQPPFPYSHYPSSPLHYHRIPPLNSANLLSTLLLSPTQPSHTLSYPSLASLPRLPYHTPSLPYHTLSHTLRYPPLPYPHLGSPPFPTLPSAPLPSPTLSYPLIYSLSPSTLSLHQLPTQPHRTPPLPFLTPLPYSALYLLSSPTIHSPPLIPSPDVPYPPISPPQPLPSSTFSPFP